MKQKNSIIIFIFSLVILFTAVFVFITKITGSGERNSRIDYYSNQISNEISFFENDYGVNHIVSQNDEDLFFAIGYYHASRRLFQMDYYRRLASGRISEIKGSEYVDYDKFIRGFGLQNLSYQIWDSLSSKSQLILDSYSKGVNFYIKENNSKLSIEFNALNYFPDKWEPAHSIMILRLFALQYSRGIWTDIINSAILDKVGSQSLHNFIPDFSQTSLSNITPENVNNSTYKFSNILKNIKQIGIQGSNIGSNCWTSSYYDSIYSVNILANDLHDKISIPSKWLPVHITNLNINTVGLTIPGIPLPFTGRNDKIAWGFTNMMADDFDYFSLNIDKSGKYYLLNDTNRKEIQFIKDTINVKNSLPVYYYKRKTDVGIILSDLKSKFIDELNNHNTLQKSKIGNSPNLVFKWTGHKVSDELFCLYKINSSNSLKECLNIFNNWAAPALNYHVIDRYGNSCRFVAGVIPVRDPNINPQILSKPISIPWHGFINLNQQNQNNMHYKNYYEVSANNSFTINNINYISNYWESDSRFKRISEVLSYEKSHNSSNAKYLQLDYFSEYSKTLLSKCIPVIKDKNQLLNSKEKNILYKIEKWDNILNPDSYEATIYSLYIRELTKNTFSDELGEELFNQYTYFSNIYTRKLMQLILSNEESIVFDNVNTKDKENRDYQIFISFRNAIKEAEKIYKSTKLYEWKYRKLHSFKINHILNNPDINPLFENDSIYLGGDFSTINNSEWDLNSPFTVKTASIVRFITDLNEDYASISLLGGISGDSQSQYFKNLIQLWQSGGYVKISIAKSPTSNFVEKIRISKDD